MLQTIKNAWKIPELRKKLIFTLFMLLIFRVGSVIPVPYINRTMLEFYLATPEMSGTILGLYNVMSGGAFANATAFAPLRTVWRLAASSPCQSKKSR